MKLKKGYVIALVLALTVIATGVVSCKKAATTPPGPNTGSLIQTDGIITGEIKVIKSMPTGYPWQFDVLIQTSQNVGDLKNPVADKVGQVVQFGTDEQIELFKVGQIITAHVKLTGDVEVGTHLYIYNIK